MMLMAVAILPPRGAASVTGSGFIILAATMSVVPAISAAGIAAILGADRFMNECRALTNSIGDAVAAIVVARWKKAVDLARLRAAFAGPGSDLTDHEGDAHQIEEQSDAPLYH